MVTLAHHTIRMMKVIHTRANLSSKRRSSLKLIAICHLKLIFIIKMHTYTIHLNHIVIPITDGKKKLKQRRIIVESGQIMENVAVCDENIEIRNKSIEELNEVKDNLGPIACGPDDGRCDDDEFEESAD